MSNKKVKEIIKFSFYKSIQNKWFVVFNILSLISIVIMLNLNIISPLFNNQKEFTFEILDNSNIVYEELAQNDFESKNIIIAKVEENNYDSDNIPDNLALIEVIPNNMEGFRLKIISKEGISGEIYEPVAERLTMIRNKVVANNFNISDSIIETMQSDIKVERIMLGVDNSNSYEKEMFKLFSATATYLVAVFLFSKLANEISQEKHSKSIEYILTTVSEKEYLYAKVFANVFIVIIQGMLLIAYYLIGYFLNCIISGAFYSVSENLNLVSIDKSIVLYILGLVIYNVLNLILISIIVAVAASKTNSSSESSNAVSLIIFAMMAVYFIVSYVITPYSKVKLWMYIVSCIPCVSAYFVPAMMVVGQANPTQIFISLALLIVSIPIAFKLCAKPFKNGILNYKRVKEKKKVESQENILIKREMKSVGFVIGLSLLIYIGLELIFSLIGGMLISAIFKDVLNSTDMILLLQIILQVISLGISSLFVSMYITEKNIKKKVSAKSKGKIILITVALVFAVQFVLQFIYPVVGLDYEITDMFEIGPESSLISKIILILALSVTPAIFEELFFRKMLIDYTSKFSKKFAVIFSAVMFGLIHMNLSQGLFAFIIGVMFGAIYLYTGDIKITMIIHAINNGVAALEMISTMTGVAIIGAMLLLCMGISLVMVIIMLKNKNSRGKILSIFKTKVSLKSFNEKYKYIFTSYMFDISILLVFLMSIVTEISQRS